MLTLRAVPFQWSAGLAGFYAVILRQFQNSDRASTWLVFGLVWMVCATAAVTSAFFVLCVAEMRKRILARQFARQVSAPRAERRV
jgi:threonine/homoserine/homoserine lactone efflux protein